MSKAMKDAVMKDLEAALKALKKYPNEVYTFYSGHLWINELLGREYISKDAVFGMVLPEVSFKELAPVIQEAIEKLKEEPDDSNRIQDFYYSSDHCCFLNFVNQLGYDEFGY